MYLHFADTDGDFAALRMEKDTMTRIDIDKTSDPQVYSLTIEHHWHGDSWEERFDISAEEAVRLKSQLTGNFYGQQAMVGSLR